jgi:ribosome-associated protein
VLVWNFIESKVLSEVQKAKLLALSNTYVNQKEVRISSEKTRSQFKNKEDTLLKLKDFLVNAFKEKKKRKPTKVPKSVVRKRLDNKADKGKIKSTRKKIDVRRLKDE